MKLICNGHHMPHLPEPLLRAVTELKFSPAPFFWKTNPKKEDLAKNELDRG